jgi:hypothetical protein
MWFILATERASGRNLDALVSSRDDVEAKMTPDQVAEAEAGFTDQVQHLS